MKRYEDSLSGAGAVVYCVLAASLFWMLVGALIVWLWQI